METDFVVIDTPDVPIQCASHGNTAIDFRHVRAAVQRVAGAVQLIGNVKWWSMSLARFEVIVNDFEMACSFFRKYIQQNRIHFESVCLVRLLLACRLRNRQNNRIRIAFGERICPGHQQTDIRFRIRADFKLFDKFRQRFSRLQNEIDHWGRTCERSVNQLV